MLNGKLRKTYAYARGVLRIGLALSLILAEASAPLRISHAATATLPELPRVFIDTTFNLPTGGTTQQVKAGDDLQAAIDQASMGDVIVLEAGATFTGNFILPNKPGDGWIYIISSDLDKLPLPGTRVGPKQAQFMPKIVSPNSQPVLTTLFGTHHYRLVGIEFSVEEQNYNLILLGFGLNQPTDPLWMKQRADTSDELPSHITFDRVYLHSTSDTNFSRTGILADGKHIAVIDSYLSNFKDRSDAQAIASWQGQGPFKIVNNFLEGSGENILFGGESTPIPNAIPSDIEIRGNYFFKRPEWNQNLVLWQDPVTGEWVEPPLNCCGFPLRGKLVQAKWDPSHEFIFVDWTIKNLFELKLAQRVLIEGNIFENNWLDAQSGIAILFTVANQYGDTTWAVVQDVTFENNIIRKSRQGFLIIGDRPPALITTKRIAIHNNLLEDIERRFFLINTVDKPLLDLTVTHNTLLHATLNEGSVMLMEGNGDTPPYDAAHVDWNDNLVSHGAFGISKTGGPIGQGAMDQRFDGYEFVKNVLFGDVRNKASVYPVDNFHPQDISEVGFVDFSGGNYRLSNSSLYRNAATDGKDIGVDMNALLLATECVEAGTCVPVAPDPSPGPGPTPPDQDPPTVSIPRFINVFNPLKTTLQIPINLNTSKPVEITIYDRFGHKVRTLIQGSLPAGVTVVKWDGRNAKGKIASAGFYRLGFEIGGDTTFKKIVLIK